ncbi:MAG TPA: ABC transporter ATP-binding protein, partial [Armatimonadota bacterium]|nr:ABC transporter ATP-binding protein [Armatimonadota bacterium]
MTVTQRLALIATPYRGTLTASLALVVLTTFIETVIYSVLFSALLFFVVGEQFLRARNMSMEYFGFDLGQALARFANSKEPMTLLLVLAAFSVLVVFIKCAAASRQGYLINKFANLMARDIRQLVFGHFLRLSPSQLEKDGTGALLSRTTADVVVLQSCLGQQLVEIIHAPLTILFSVIAMLLIDWRLTGTALLLAPIIAALIAVAGRKIRKLAVIIQDRFAAMNAALVERLGNIRVIQSFVREPYEHARIGDVNDIYYRETMRAVRLSELLTPGVEFIAMLGFVIGILIGGVAVFSGHIAPEKFFLFLALAQKAGSQFRGLSRITQVRQQATGAADCIFRVLDVEPEITDAPDARPLARVEGRVTFEAVSFRYATGSDVLADITFEAEPGEVIALVGPSGAGKTTLINLIPRFYDPTAGRICLDGADIRAVTLASLRGHIGTVPQETALFSGTIEENIRYGKLDAPADAVMEAARAANALEFIARLPDGVQTVIGERGARLSGGQRQRIAIARALLKNPRILILDEATSALDTESEMLVQTALDRLMLGRTTFVIAHRLSTIQHATRILVLERGRIVESGPHVALLEQNGL